MVPMCDFHSLAMAGSQSAIFSPPQKWRKTVLRTMRFSGKPVLKAVVTNGAENFTSEVLPINLNSHSALRSSGVVLSAKATSVLSNEMRDTQLIKSAPKIEIVICYPLCVLWLDLTTIFARYEF